jgi:hypothetical protein
MVTKASPATSVDFLVQIDELRGQAASQGKEYQDLLNQANQKLAERNHTLLQIGEIAKTAAETTGVESIGTSSAVAVAAVVPSQGLVPRQKRAYTKRSDAEKAASPKATTGKRGRPSASGQENKMSLKEVVIEILSRTPAQHKKSIPDYPAGETGLKVPEIRTIVESEKKWVSSSSQVGVLIQQALYKLADEKKVERAENRRYNLVKAG